MTSVIHSRPFEKMIACDNSTLLYLLRKHMIIIFLRLLFPLSLSHFLAPVKCKTKQHKTERKREKFNFFPYYAIAWEKWIYTFIHIYVVVDSCWKIRVRIVTTFNMKFICRKCGTNALLLCSISQSVSEPVSHELVRVCVCVWLLWWNCCRHEHTL